MFKSKKKINSINYQNKITYFKNNITMKMKIFFLVFIIDDLFKFLI